MEGSNWSVTPDQLDNLTLDQLRLYCQPAAEKGLSWQEVNRKVAEIRAKVGWKPPGEKTNV